MITFRNFIKLNEKLTIDEAIEKLSSFHNNTNPQNILNAFLNLRDAKKNNEGTIIFEEGVRNGSSCISMRHYNNNGGFISNSLIDEETGQPMTHSG